MRLHNNFSYVLAHNYKCSKFQKNIIIDPFSHLSYYDITMHWNVIFWRHRTLYMRTRYIVYPFFPQHIIYIHSKRTTRESHNTFHNNSNVKNKITTFENYSSCTCIWEYTGRWRTPACPPHSSNWRPSWWTVSPGNTYSGSWRVGTVRGWMWPAALSWTWSRIPYTEPGECARRETKNNIPKLYVQSAF